MIQNAPVDEGTLEALREAGQHWSRAESQVVQKSGGSSDLMIRSERTGSHPGDKYVRFERAGKNAFRFSSSGAVRATAAVPRAHGPVGRFGVGLKKFVVGDPIANELAAHERLTKIKALAVLSSDAISSVAYATGAMLSVLLAAGASHFGISLWIGAAIAILFAMVVLSYRQTIKAYPKGGGSYIVASDNLGSMAGLIAGSSLMIDYVLTVAVSVVTGVAALTSMAPTLSHYALTMDVALILVILTGNLRGLRESGSIFMLPSYLFIIGIYAMLISGTVHFVTGGFHVSAPPPGHPAVEALGAFLVLRAFASGCTALTGVEAISDGVPAFEAPEWVNARTTITVLGCLAISMFLGITLMVHVYGLVPNPGDTDPTLISKLNSVTLGSGPAYYYVQLTTALILMLAANTAFSDFPRLAYFMARDSFLPHQFGLRGDRLSYSNGILVLGALAIALVLIFKGSFEALINLYVIGVFASFTLSQSGMVRRWLTRREAGWRKGLVLNGTGAALTLVVLFITAFTKFIYGAWLVVLLVPLMVFTFYRIRAHYRHSAAALRPHMTAAPHDLYHTVILSAWYGQATEQDILAYATTLKARRILILHRPGRSFAATEGSVEMVQSAQRSERRAIFALIAAERGEPAHSQVTVVLPPTPAGPLGRVRQSLLRRALLGKGRVAVAQVSRGIVDARDGKRRTSLVTVARLNLAALDALAYTQSLLKGRVLGVHVATEGERDQTRREWEAWGNHVPLVTIDSPFRAIVAPLRAYIDALGQAETGETITVVVPVVFAPGLLGRLLHNHTANRVRRVLLQRANTAVVSLPHFIP